MYRLAHNSEVDELVQHGDWRTADQVGRQITEQIAKLDNPADYTVLAVTGNTDGLCPVMKADRWGNAPIGEYLGVTPTRAVTE